MTQLTLANDQRHLPWSGNPVSNEALHYRGHVVGFCKTGYKFEKATAIFAWRFG
jgi:hypothetical protein